MACTVACSPRPALGRPTMPPDGTGAISEGTRTVVQAYILIQTEVGKSAAVTEAVSGISGVIAAQDVTGPYDCIARVEAGSVDELGKLVIARIQETPGITRTLTCTVVNV